MCTVLKPHSSWLIVVTSVETAHHSLTSIIISREAQAQRGGVICLSHTANEVLGQDLNSLSTSPTYYWLEAVVTSLGLGR